MNFTKGFTRITLLFFLLASSFALHAQHNNDSSIQVSYGKAQLSYLSNNVYNGRADSLASPYITPSLGYYNKSGFYIGGSLSYQPGSTGRRIDLVSIDIGYGFDITDNLSDSIYATKTFYNKQSTAIKSDIKELIGNDISYDFDIVQLSVGAELLIGTKTDVAFNAELSHIFKVGSKNGSWSFVPAASLNVSSLHFYEGYTTRKANKKLMQSNPNISSINSLTTVSNPGIKLMDYELELPVTYESKKWGAFITGTYAIPQNPIFTTTVTTKKVAGVTSTQTVDSTPFSERKLKNIFYAELGIYFKF